MESRIWDVYTALTRQTSGWGWGYCDEVLDEIYKIMAEDYNTTPDVVKWLSLEYVYENPVVRKLTGDWQHYGTDELYKQKDYAIRSAIALFKQQLENPPKQDKPVPHAPVAEPPHYEW
jgi:hypothetical protein